MTSDDETESRRIELLAYKQYDMKVQQESSQALTEGAGESCVGWLCWGVGCWCWLLVLAADAHLRH